MVVSRKLSAISILDSSDREWWSLVAWWIASSHFRTYVASTKKLYHPTKSWSWMFILSYLTETRWTAKKTMKKHQWQGQVLEGPHKLTSQRYIAKAHGFSQAWLENVWTMIRHSAVVDFRHSSLHCYVKGCQSGSTGAWRNTCTLIWITSRKFCIAKSFFLLSSLRWVRYLGISPYERAVWDRHLDFAIPQKNITPL